VETDVNPEFRASVLAAACACAFLFAPAPAHAADWQPSKTIEIEVAAGPGGGTDQMARLIQSVITRYKLAPVPTVVTNRGGGNGAEGFLDMTRAKGDPYKIIVGTNNAYLLPLVTKLGYQWQELTPVAVLVQDEFILWTTADAPYKTATDYLDAVKADPSSFKMGGSQSKDADQTLTQLINQTYGTRLAYIPFKSGSEAAAQLAAGHITSNVNNPVENLAQWRAGKVKPLCVFAKRPMRYTEKVADKAWSEIPTCKEQGLAIPWFRLPRTVFMPGGVSREQLKFYVDLMKRVTQTAEFAEYVERNALNEAFLDGEELNDYIDGEESRVRAIFDGAGWLVK
jgi:tripartite-type tricarboxylate transporter receptor subunit TctC